MRFIQSRENFPVLPFFNCKLVTASTPGPVLDNGTVLSGAYAHTDTLEQFGCSFLNTDEQGGHSLVVSVSGLARPREEQPETPLSFTYPVNIKLKKGLWPLLHWEWPK